MSHVPIERLGPGSLGPEPKLAGEADAGRWLPVAVTAYGHYAVSVVTALLAAALVSLVALYECSFVTLEPDWKSIALCASVTVFLASLAAWVSRRPIASIALACALMGLPAGLSIVKFHYLKSSLFALDFYYYVRPTELVFLYEHFPKVFLAGCATLIATCAVLVLLFFGDDTRVSRRHAAMSLGFALLGMMLAYHWQGERDKTYHFVGRNHVSSLAASVPEAFAVFLQGGLLKAADRGGKITSDPVPHLQNAIPGQAPPTIISILHESSFPTSLYPAQCGGPAPEALYTSSNGKTYDLRVETFGGATWLTEYGLMLGLSTYAFGEARNFIGYTMEHRIHDSLPMQMQRNGYRTLALYPSPKSFINTERFYAALGFDRLLDYYDLNANSELERDRFYYGKAIEQIRAHRASGSKAPLFIQLWTMATHGPYDSVLHPDVPPEPGAVCAKDKSWAEYIRRLLMSETDLAWLTASLKAEFPDEPFMIAGFGDHQPYIASDFTKPSRANTHRPTRNSIGYTTFFRITGVNFLPDWSVVPKSIDTPFLGNVMMLAARLPRHGFYNDRDRLMELCRGRYNDCPAQDEIMSFHDRLLRSRTIARQ